MGRSQPMVKDKIDMINKYNENPRLPNWLIIGMTIAMLGNIKSHVRLIVADYDNERKILNFITYFSKPFTDEDEEDMKIMMTELGSGWGQYVDDCYFKCIYSLKPKNELDQLSGAIFSNKEF